MSTQFSYQFSDFKEARKTYRKTTGARIFGVSMIAVSGLILIPFICPLCIVLPYGFSVKSSGQPFPDMIWNYLGWILLFFLIYAILLALIWTDAIFVTLIWLSSKRNAKLYRDPIEFSFDDTGTSFKREKTSTQQKWKFYRSILESKNVFVLVHGRKSYWTLPKRAFFDEEEVNQFRELSKAKLESKA